MDIKNNLNKILDITHEILHKNLLQKSYKNYDNENFEIITTHIKPCDFLVNYNTDYLTQQLNWSMTKDGIKIDKIYLLEVKLQERELALEIDDLINEVIEPACHALKYKIQEYYFSMNKDIVVPNYQSESYIVKYQDNIGIGISFKENILGFQVFCGHII